MPTALTVNVPTGSSQDNPHARLGRQVVHGLERSGRQDILQGGRIGDVRGLGQPQDLVTALAQVGEKPGPDEPIAPGYESRAPNDHRRSGLGQGKSTSQGEGRHGHGTSSRYTSSVDAAVDAHENSSARRRPCSAIPARRDPSARSASIALGPGPGIARRDQQGGRPGHLPDSGDVRGDDGDAGGHRLQHGQAEPS